MTNPDVPEIPSEKVTIGEESALQWAVHDTLEQIYEFISRYLIIPTEEQRWAFTAWIYHCVVIEAFDSTPRLAVLSPEKRTGKTRMFEVADLLLEHSMFTNSISQSSLFRSIHNNPQLVVLIDEGDTIWGPFKNALGEGLRGIVNSGHRRGVTVSRTEKSKEGMKTETFRTFCPVAINGIGSFLPDTIVDRSIVINMKRRTGEERVEPFRYRTAEQQVSPIRARMENERPHVIKAVDGYFPVMPVQDRSADVWEPLVIIGDLALGEWKGRIRKACVVMETNKNKQATSIGECLLKDIWIIFEGKAVKKIFTRDLLKELNELEESPWGDFQGSPLDERKLAKLLRPYEITPKQIRIGENSAKGYDYEDFWETWTRYTIMKTGVRWKLNE